MLLSPTLLAECTSGANVKGHILQHLVIVSRCTNGHFRDNRVASSDSGTASGNGYSWTAIKWQPGHCATASRTQLTHAVVIP